MADGASGGGHHPSGSTLKQKLLASGRGMMRRVAGAFGLIPGHHQPLVADTTGSIPQTRPWPMPMPAAGNVAVGRMALTDSDTERGYRLFRPATVTDQTGPVPLVVWLHGCTQTADDFTTGTRIDRFASERGFLVLMPEQEKDANPGLCWNWFSRADQQRDRGEAALIAAMTQAAVAGGLVDPARVYVAGLSAGGAMAALLGQLWPKLYAGVAVHSGLPARAARNVPTALWAMRRGATPGRGIDHSPPLIIFHGDEDETVVLANATALATQYAPDPARIEERSVVRDGRKPARILTRYDASGRVRVVMWEIAGGGHGWMGGDGRGSHTEPQGPDATDEILRFWLEQKENL